MGILADIKAVLAAGGALILCLILWYADHNRLERKVLTLQAEAQADEAAIRDRDRAIADRDASLVDCIEASRHQNAEIRKLLDNERALESALELEGKSVSEAQQEIEDLQAQLMFMEWPGTCEDMVRGAVRVAQRVTPGGQP